MIKNNVKKIYIILMLLCILVGCVQPTEVSSKKQVEPSKQEIEVDSPIGGIAQINQNGKIGYQKEDGTILVNPTYDLSDPSPEEHENYRLLGKSQEDGTVLWGHVTNAGIVVEPQFDKPYTFFENVIVPNSEIFQLAFVYQNGEGGIIKQTGEWFIEIGIYFFKEQVGNLAVVSEKEFPTKLGVIPGNSGNKILIPFIFDTIDIRKESIGVEINDKRGSYTMDGILILDPKFKNVHYQRNGYIEFSVGEHDSAEELFGIATIGGEIVVPAEYDLIYNEVEGLTIAIKDKKYGYFDENWQIAIPFEYDFAYDFASGIALVKKEGEFFFITKENQFAFSLPENYNLYNAKFTDGIGFLMIDQREQKAVIEIDSANGIKFHVILFWKLRESKN